jgi:small subunit ribosomal protein S16
VLRWFGTLEEKHVLKIRLKRAGSKARPFYRVVVMDSRTKRDGRAVDEIGYYDPLEDPIVVNVDRDKVTHWTERGAQLTDSVRSLLRRENSTHPTRRTPDSFEPEVREAKKPKAEAAAAAAATATAEAPAKPKKAEKAEKEEKAEKAAEAPAEEAAPAEAPAEAPAAEAEASDQTEEIQVPAEAAEQAEPSADAEQDDKAKS